MSAKSSRPGFATPICCQWQWPETDWRVRYFTPKNLAATVARADALKRILPDGMSLAELALRFVLSNPDVSVVIPTRYRAGLLAEAIDSVQRQLEAVREHQPRRKKTGIVESLIR